MWKPDTLVFAKADQTLMRILRKLRPYVDYGYIIHLSLETIKFMIHNAAAIVVDNIRITRFTNEPALVEQVFINFTIFLPILDLYAQQLYCRHLVSTTYLPLKIL
ncbi:hypothetical protein Leryth_005019 [Lithospermum erythrorhizon]|nr:hypothetical protein Leryth_005019 [Lithospermum erythrorhizon]